MSLCGKKEVRVMSKTVQISIIHYADEDELHCNDVLALLVKSIRELTEYPYELNIIDNQMPPKAREDLDEKVPDVDILRNNTRSYSAGCNLAMRSFDTDYLVVLHTDLLVSWNWLTCAVKNLVDSEKHYGVPCVTTFRLLPYPMSLKLIPWDTFLENVVSPETVISELDKWGFPWKTWNGIPIAISRPGLVTDHGWQIGVYMAGREFFDEVGPKEEALEAYEDLDYGLRALATRCRSLISENVVLHHCGGLSALSGVWKGGGGRLNQPLIDKFGEGILDKLLDGSIWLDLHKKQSEKYGK